MLISNCSKLNKITVRALTIHILMLVIFFWKNVWLLNHMKTFRNHLYLKSFFTSPWLWVRWLFWGLSLTSFQLINFTQSSVSSFEAQNIWNVLQSNTSLKQNKFFQNYSSLVNKNLACRLQQISAVNGCFFTKDE